MKEKIDLTKLPKHIAIIMDGNGRWAQKRGLDRSIGHQEGVVSIRKITEAAGELGIDYLTVYTFSTENWNRPETEVSALMELMVLAVQQETPDLMKNNVRLLVIGEINRLQEKTRTALMGCVEETSRNTGLTLVLAVSYSSRWEIAEAAKQIALKVNSGSLKAEDINEDTFTDHLTTKNIPDPDLLIRTGGEQRISNFLLWQVAYTEFYFTDVYWPDFRKENLHEAIADYQSRQRRFGKTGEQVQ